MEDMRCSVTAGSEQSQSTDDCDQLSEIVMLTIKKCYIARPDPTHSKLTNFMDQGINIRRMKFSTHILDEFLKRKRSENEKLRQQVIEKINEILEELSKKKLFEEAYIFGSITKPFVFGKNSDIDIAFTGLKDKDFFLVMSTISNELGRDVDVIQLENHRLAEKIKKEGIRWRRKD